MPRLVKAGYRVAICDQLEDPKQTKTIVKRGVTELVTPGVALDDEILQAKTNNFLASIVIGKHKNGISFLDISTGEFLTAEGDIQYLDKLLQNFNPSEILVSRTQKKDFLLHFGENFQISTLEDWIYTQDYAFETLTKHFQTNSLKGFGIDDFNEAIISAGAILFYLSETEHNQLKHLSSIQRIPQDEYVWLDRFTIRNLELYNGQSPQSVTLLDIIDKTISPMGSRTLKRWIALPLKNLQKIQQRHEIVTSLLQKKDIYEKIREKLNEISDIERLISKVATQKITPRELIQLKNSLLAIEPIKKYIYNLENPYINSFFGKKLDNCTELIYKISTTLNEEAPVNILKGNAIKQGYSKELDELRNLSHSGKNYLDEMLQRESESTQIPSLKIDNNNVFGYYFEVRNTHKDKVPEHWVRKQTLVNAERYITQELKEYEEKIFGAEEKIAQLEQKYFAELILEVSNYILQVQTNAFLIGQLDCLCCFAQLAIEYKYVCPKMDESFVIDIKNGRHPVIERKLPANVPYIANDIYLDNSTQQIIMITGPNMSGKSAILRQTALIVLLAQMGCYVPADGATIGIVDKIFTRVGASDNISQGESTFMVEMNESALILNNISERSLVLLDEIGRGTSTYDGISIAWAIAEYLHEHPTRAKTLFATHYHELNEMTETFSRIKNYNVSVKEVKNSVLFLRKLVKGGSEHSFGIQVAKMAGMPQYVIEKANNVLKRLEKTHKNESTKEALSNKNADGLQLSFFQLDDPLLESIKDEIINTNIDNLTPLEALMKLNNIKKMLLGK